MNFSESNQRNLKLQLSNAAIRNLFLIIGKNKEQTHKSLSLFFYY